MHGRTPVSDSTIDRLREISHWVSSVLDLDNLLELIIDTATKMMQAKASSLLLLDPKTKKLYFKVAIGERKEELRKYEINLGQGIAGLVAQTGEPLLIQDVTHDPRWYKQISESIGFQTRSIACVPMKVGDEIIGVVEIIDKEDGSEIQNEDMKTLTVFTELASLAISNARKINQVQRENRDLKEELWKKYQIIGESPILKKAISDALKVANSRTSTMLLGESGTGKELLARLIHYVGPRKEKPLIILNCAALPETLLEAELFGYEKGAFTGALTRKIGKFELADGGTLFLDEIGEIPLELQSKLLRVLEEGNFERLGSTKTLQVNVRIIAATNRDLGEEVKTGRFRKDLYYRLNVFPIVIPPLRERPEDIPLLVWAFVRMFQERMGKEIETISKKTMEVLQSYSWPGNVRELKNVIEYAMILSKDKNLRVQLPRPGSLEIDATQTLKDTERRHILAVLERTGWRLSGDGGAAEALGLKRTTLHEKMKKLGIKRPNK